MSIFIKAGLWAEKRLGYKGELNLTQLIENATPYKKYVALVTQTGTNDPTVIVLENTLGVTPTWYYASTGNVYAESFGTWKTNKTGVTVGPLGPASKGVGSLSYIDTEDQLHIVTVKAANTPESSCLVNTMVEIRVYN